jgi:hypothetical protein
MIQPLLSIQIPFTEDRKAHTDLLLREFKKQIAEYRLENLIVFDLDGRGKEITIGDKRNDLYNISKGLYTVQWDSDDWICENGLQLICDACKIGADCVTYEELVLIDSVPYSSNFSLDYGGWEGDGHKVFPDGFNYHRTPFFKTPIKTEICKQVGVNSSRFGEDNDFADRIKPLLKIQVHINKAVYQYIHNKTPYLERYGFDKD